MSILQSGFALLEQGILWLVLITLLAGKRLDNLPQRKGVIGGLLVAVLVIPVNGLSLGAWLRSVIGDLSMMGMVVFADVASRRIFSFRLVCQDVRQWVLRGIVLTGLMFYPLALGMSALDPYQWGYAPVVMGVALAGSAFWAWLNGARGLALLLLLPVLAYHLQLLESRNLWDYLIDPVVFVYALVQAVVYPVARKKL